METYGITPEKIQALFRPLTPEEKEKTEALIPVVLDTLRQEALNVGKELDMMIERGQIYESVLLSVVTDIVARVLMTSTNKEPMSQFSESALGYSVSGTFLSPGGGLFIKKSELSRLGLKKQRIRLVNMYGDD